MKLKSGERIHLLRSVPTHRNIGLQFIYNNHCVEIHVTQKMQRSPFILSGYYVIYSWTLTQNFLQCKITAAVAQSVLAFACKVGCSNSSRDKPNSLKQGVTAPLQTLNNRCKCHGSSEMNIINGCPLSQ